MHYLIYFLVIIAGFVLQRTAGDLLAIYGREPDFLLMVLVFLALDLDRIPGTVAGFFVGIFQDLLSSGLLGLSALTKSAVGFLAGWFSRNDRRGEFISFGLILWGSALVHDLLFYLLYTLGKDLSFWQLAVHHALPASLYTLLIGMILFSLLPVGVKERLKRQR